MLILSSLITIGLTILAITVVLAVVFFLMYHTFHGDLPRIMKLVIGIMIIVGTLFVIFNYLL